MTVEREFKFHEGLELMEVVAESALVLDFKEPGWEKRVDPEYLDMGIWFKCIFGQLYGSYTQGCRIHGIPEGHGVLYGLHGTQEELTRMEEYWTKEIQKRLVA